MSTEGDEQREEGVWPAGVVLAVTGTLLLIGFVYAYPAIFERLDTTRPDRYLPRVEAALESGDTGRAVTIARDAAKWMPLDPMAHTMLGRALMADGNVAAGLAALEKAFAVPTTGPPAYSPTHRYHFFAPARLSLAREAWENGETGRALEHLVLAAVYADPSEVRLIEFDSMIQGVYTAAGLEPEVVGANWRGLGVVSPGEDATPGWVDVARDWYGLRTESAGRVVIENERVVLAVTNDDIHKTALYYSIPVEAGGRRSFMLRGELFAPTTPAVIGWQALDVHERIVDEGWLFNQETTEVWERRETMIEANYFHAEIRVILGVTRHEGEAFFSNVALVPRDD